MTRKPVSAYDAAVGYLARRSHSRRELKNKLFRKGFPAREIYQALDRLEELGYVDDRKFAVEYARYRLRQSPRGKRVLIMELLQRGVGREIIDDVLPEVFDEFPEVNLVAGLVAKWNRARGDSYTRDDITKLARSLARKGFDWDVIRRHIDTLTPIEPSADN
jgi:regulatory protein